MKRVAIGTLFLISTCLIAQAEFSQSELEDVYAYPKPDAQLPLDQDFTDDLGRARTLAAALDGKPAVVVFSDYTCTTLCGPVLAFAAGGLEKSGLTPGRDFHLIVIGLDPKDSLETARAMKASHIGIGTPLANAVVMLTGKADAITAETTAAGYHYIYDKEADQFAHPAAAYVVTAQGRVSRVLSSLGLHANDLRLALTEAGEGRVGTLADRIRLLCYCFDPATGIYSAAISRFMLAAGMITVLAMAGTITLLTIRMRRRQRT
jgi:protein SCO1